MNDAWQTCPVCGAATGDEATCPACGFEVHGPDATTLRDLAAQLDTLERELVRVSARRQAVARELQRLRFAASAAPPPPPPSATWQPPVREWSAERVRGVLLWLGVVLLASSALTFTVVAWARLGDGGRAGLLAGVTTAAVALAIALRFRLPATAEAVSGLAIALALIDWHALRRVSAAQHVSGSAWWALGGVVVSGFAFVLGRLSTRAPARVVTAVLLPVSAALTVVTVGGAAWSVGLGFALVSASIVVALRVVDGRVEQPLVVGLLTVEAAIAWMVAVVAGVVSTAQPHSFTATLAPAVTVAALALAPAIAITRRPASNRADALLTSLVAASSIGTCVIPMSTTVGADGLLLWAALLAVVAIAFAGTEPERRRQGTAWAAVAALAPGAALAIASGLVSMFGPLGWLGRPWSSNLDRDALRVVLGPHDPHGFVPGWTLVGVLLAVTAAGLLAATTTGRRHRVARPVITFRVAAVCAALATTLAPIAAGASVRTACGTTVAAACALIVVSAVLTRWRPDVAQMVSVSAAVVTVPAIGWSSVTPRASVTALCVGLLAALVATVLGRTEPLRTLDLGLAAAVSITLAGVATAASGASAGATGFATALTAAALVTCAAYCRWESPDAHAIDGAGVAGFAAGAFIAVTSPTWLAAAFTVAVPLLSIAALRRDRATVYAASAGAAALAAAWTWLGAAGVQVVEAYTLPAAVAALVAGAFAWRVAPARSWTSFGPGIALALGPTLALAVRDDDVFRSVLVAIAALVVVLVGAQRRLQAPLVLGAATLLVLGIDTFGPAAARLPRWAVLAVAGALLLWIGATFERRRERVRRATETLMHFG